MKRPAVWLVVVCLGALMFRLLLLPLAQHPGIADPTHYYNLGQRLLDGHGFTIDYIWAFHRPYEQIEHPEDHWMPMTGLTAAVSMALFGRSHMGAVVLFAFVGALTPALAYAASRRLHLSPSDALLAALLCAVVPELVLNSLRTDTTILNAFWLGLGLLAAAVALERQQARWYALAGLFAGLAYLVRIDALSMIPAIGLLVVVYWVMGQIQPRWKVFVALMLPAVAIVTVLPWLLRNLEVHGRIGGSDIFQSFLYVDFRDLYRYDNPPTVAEFFERQTPAQIVNRRLFELTASSRLMLVMLTDSLALMVVGGVVFLFARQDRQRLVQLAPMGVTLGVLLISYPILMTTHNQGGSFKKAYLSLVPLTVPIGIYGLAQVVPNVKVRTGVAFVAAALMAMSSFELVRDQNRFVNSYVAMMQQVVQMMETLPDTNDDGRIVLMTQDPFVLRYLGYQGVQFPFEDRDTIAYVARRYSVDYLLMPSARPALEPLERGQEQDARFQPMTDALGRQMPFWRFRALSD
jgi:hypothetical protein